jgi:hypothetical protein
MKSIDPTFYVILEMFSANKEEAVYASQGMMCWNNMSTNGEQALMSYNDSGGSWDLTGLFYDSWGFAQSTGNVSYFESHDQERLQFKNEAYGNSSGSYNVTQLPTGLQRDEMGAAFMFSSPGPKMLWEFGESGYDVSINDANSGGRLGDKPRPYNLSTVNHNPDDNGYTSDPNRAHLMSVYTKMINMKIKNPVFSTTSFTYNLGGAYKFIQLLGGDGTYVEVVGNFDVVSQVVTINFPSTGTWYDNLNGTSINVTNKAYSTTLLPGEYHVYSNSPLKM